MVVEKTEKQKMLAGELYFAADEELKRDRQRARRLTRIYNYTREDEQSDRLKILVELFGAVGETIYTESCNKRMFLD